MNTAQRSIRLVIFNIMNTDFSRSGRKEKQQTILDLNFKTLAKFIVAISLYASFDYPYRGYSFYS